MRKHDMAQDPQGLATMQPDPAFEIPEIVSVRSYLDRLSDTRPAELVFGSIRPLHPLALPDKCAADRISQVIEEHLAAANIHATFTAPVDVILDVEHCVVVHPNIAVVLPERRGIVGAQDQLWGAPNFLVEVLHTGRAKRARQLKTRWYHSYGVDECWLIDPHARTVELFHTSSWSEPRLFREGSISSQVLPGLTVSLDRLFPAASSSASSASPAR
jgi:Uma2 family endonuclease